MTNAAEVATLQLQETLASLVAKQLLLLGRSTPNDQSALQSAVSRPTAVVQKKWTKLYRAVFSLIHIILYTSQRKIFTSICFQKPKARENTACE